MPIIQARHLYKVFGPRPEWAVGKLRDGMDQAALRQHDHLAAVIDADFDVAEGELFVVMGLSGSGKSTLVRMINRLHQPSAGSLEVHGTDIASLDAAALRRLRSRSISMVFQRFGLLPHRTVRENAAYGLRTQGLSAGERLKRADEALGVVGLEGWGDSYPSELSGGMQQRVGIARALATDADILLMDEPFSALDPIIRRDMQSLLLELQDQLHKTIVFITHDLNEAMLLGDRIAVMKAGRIVQIGTGEEILSDPADDYVAAFTADVDRSRVLTAGSVMRPPVATLSPKDGPRGALRLMEEHDRSELYVLDARGRISGWVHASDLRTLLDRRASTLDEVLRHDHPHVSADTSVAALFPIASQHSLPISVTDGDGLLLGVVPRARLLAALSPPPDESAQPAMAAGPEDTEGGAR